MRINLFLVLLFCLVTGAEIVAQPVSNENKKADRVPDMADTSRINELYTKSYNLAISEPEQSAKYREQAFKLSRSLGFKKGFAWNDYLKGISYTYKYNYLKAIDTETRAIKQAQQINNFEIIARAYNVIGLCNVRLGDDYHAMLSFQQALKAVNKSADKTFLSAIIHNIGSLYAKQKKFNKSFYHFNRAVQLNIKSGNKQWLAQNYLEIGQAFYSLSDFKKAEGYGQRSLLLASQVKYARCEIQSLALLGSIHNKLKNFEAAKKYLDSGYEKAIAFGVDREKLEFYQEYSTWYALQKNFQQAYHFKDMYATAHDNFNKQNRNKLILEYQEKFKTEQKEAENRLLKNEQALNQEKIGQKNNLLIFFVILLVALLIFSGLVFWGNKEIKLNNRLLTFRNEEIKKQKEDVEHLNHIKDKLFSVIAHDLRSPFANMKSMMDLYDDGMISKEEIDFFLKEIRKDIGSNTLLLENLLIWAKSQLSGFTINPVPVSIKRMVDEVSFINKKKLIKKGISIANDLDSNEAAYADYEMTQAVIRNLIGNAIKFTPQNGHIQISANRQEGQLKISVTDSGIGINQEQKDQLFKETFFSTPGLNNEKGTGIGLQICKDFVEKNQGSLWLDASSAEGSTFCFTLPESDIPLNEPVHNLQTSEELDKKSFREMVKNNMALQYRFDLYELVAKVTKDTVYDVNLVENEITWNGSLFSNFGFSYDRTEGEWWIQMVHPDDRDAVEKSITLALKERQRKWEFEYRFRCADGSYKYVFDRGLILLDEQGEPVRMVGTVQDIQSQKNTNHQIERLSLVAKSVNNLVVISDSEGRIIWVNKAFEALTGYMLEDILGQVPKEFLSGPKTNENILTDIDQYLHDKQSFTTELINYNKEGTPYWVQIDCTPYHDPISNQLGYVTIQTVITERKQYEELILQKNETLREIARISSHEVRRPLSSILGLVKLMESQLSEHELMECLQLLTASAAELDSLIHNIHGHIARIEQEPLKGNYSINPAVKNV